MWQEAGKSGNGRILRNKPVYDEDKFEEYCKEGNWKNLGKWGRGILKTPGELGKMGVTMYRFLQVTFHNRGRSWYIY